jgi:hypothetical protein
MMFSQIRPTVGPSLPGHLTPIMRTSNGLTLIIRWMKGRLPWFLGHVVRMIASKGVLSGSFYILNIRRDRVQGLFPTFSWLLSYIAALIEIQRVPCWMIPHPPTTLLSTTLTPSPKMDTTLAHFYKVIRILALRWLPGSPGNHYQHNAAIRRLQGFLDPGEWVRRCVAAILQCIKPIINLTAFPSPP